jgi:hypothetical protein
MRTLFFGFFLLFSSLSYGNELKSLDFTQAYITCVKAYSNESTTTQTAGIVDSGLMNGELLNGDIDANYWSFMNCITPSVSGSGSGSVIVTNGCAPEVRKLSSPDIQVYLPFKQVGKTVNINGHTFSCNSTGWNFVSSIGQERRKGCDSASIQIDACTFNIPELNHNQGGVYEDLSSSKDGSLVAYCEDGNLNYGNSSCQSNTCNAGDRVTWVTQTSGGVYMCEGSVASNGLAIASPSEHKYFATEASARAFSVVPTGSAQFYCSDGKWQRIQGVGSCNYKVPSAKVCNGISVGIAKDYYCE